MVPCIGYWCGGIYPKSGLYSQYLLSDCRRLREIFVLTHMPLGRQFKEISLTCYAANGAGVTCDVTVNGVCTVYAVEGVRAEYAEYAEYAVAICCMFERGCVPRGVVGEEDNGMSIARRSGGKSSTIRPGSMWNCPHRFSCSGSHSERGQRVYPAL